MRTVGLVIAVVVSLTACGMTSAKGHAGHRVDNAVQVEILPASGRPSTYTGSGPLHGNPFIYVHDWIKNVSGAIVKVRGCSADAVDEGGSQLFTIVAPFGRPLLLPDQEVGSRSSGTSGWAAPDGITDGDLRRVVRYEVRCDVYTWVGPLPEPYED